MAGNDQVSLPKVGDVVRLKSGSPPLTVDAIEDDRATCVWFVDKQYKSKKFALASLEANNTPKSMQVEFVMPSRREDQ
jgi:uncharacterized protein YodC (DUF2158 family)